MSLMPYGLGGGQDPFFGQMEKALDRAFARALGDRGADTMSLFLPTLAGPSSAAGHPMDIVEGKDAFTIHADTPGFEPDDIKIEMDQGTLTISGQRKEEKTEEKEGKVVRRERHFSSFTRSFTLPDNIKEEGIAANLDKGVLTVTVPKVEPVPKPQPKRITVQGSAGHANGSV